MKLPFLIVSITHSPEWETKISVVITTERGSLEMTGAEFDRLLRIDRGQEGTVASNVKEGDREYHIPNGYYSTPNGEKEVAVLKK